MKEIITRLNNLWDQLYGDEYPGLLNEFLKEIQQYQKKLQVAPLEAEWYKDAIVYSLYVDLFNKDLTGLENKLDYLAGLGVSCLWLLPILDSPMKDAGFDISSYRKIRADLLGLNDGFTKQEQDAVFNRFLDKAHEKGIRVIFDIAINHTSDEHPWFQQSRESKDNPYRDYYIWNKDDQKYKEARIIFEGIETSNWKKDGDEYYFHRFFDFQPDLNYRNPKVLLDMVRNMLFWLERGVDGFRADAIPYLWKEDGTDCENHPTTHTVVKFFRGVLDLVRPNTLLLAEACQKPYKVVKYFGDNDECNAGYNFPLMPQIFKAIAAADSKPIKYTLSKEVTPDIPEGTQWFTFLRCHDELSLELVYVTENDRKYIHDNYCFQPEWNFRLGQGISARLSELMELDPQKIGLIYSIMLTLPGTPVIYYGDEFGKLNDHDYYSEMIKLTGKDDTRFLVRGKVDWDETAQLLTDPSSFSAKVFQRVKKLIHMRKQFKCFGRGEIHWVPVTDIKGNEMPEVLVYIRSYENENVAVFQNLSSEDLRFMIPQDAELITAGQKLAGKTIELIGHGYQWVQL